MRLKGLTLNQLQDVLKTVNKRDKTTLKLYSGAWSSRARGQEFERRHGWLSFTLRLASGKDKFHRVSRCYGLEGLHSERRLNCVCWHGHRNVMVEIFKRFPEAILHSSFASYRGKDGFETNYPDTFYRNIGSQMFPQYAGESCDCQDC